MAITKESDDSGFNSVTARHSAAYAIMEGYCAAAGHTFVTVWTHQQPDIRDTMHGPAELDRWVSKQNDDAFSRSWQTDDEQ